MFRLLCLARSRAQASPGHHCPRALARPGHPCPRSLARPALACPISPCVRLVSTGRPSSSTQELGEGEEVTGSKMLGLLAGHVWPQGNREVSTAALK